MAKTETAKDPSYVAETLAWCNKLRAADKKKPLLRLPKGKRMDAESCPCGKASGWVVRFVVATRIVGLDRQIIYLPRSVIRFVTAFDKGSLPQYDATKRVSRGK